MRYETFGRRTGLRVSEYVLGTANFGSAPAAAGEAGTATIFETFVAAGGTTFDSSNLYQDGEAERRLGSLLGRERDDFVIITKYGGSRRRPAPAGTTGNSRKVMVRSLEESLRRLGTDHVDVFMPHFPDGVTPCRRSWPPSTTWSPPARSGTADSRTSRRGGSRARSPGRSSADAPRSSGSRPSTAWRSGPPSGNCCRWPRPTGSASSSTPRWPEDRTLLGAPPIGVV